MSMGFVVFLTVFLTIYGAEHAYLYLRLSPLLRSPGWLAAGLVLMIPLPILSTVLLRFGHLRSAQILGWLGFTWMGFAFLLFSFLLLGDALRLAGWLSARVGLAGLRPDPVFLVKGALVFSLVATGWAIHNARRVEVLRVPVQHPRLAGLDRPLRVLQISDLHLGLLSDASRVAHVVEQARVLQPDMILCTGDLVDGPNELLAGQAALLADLHAPLGKYAVTGNHEAYSNADAGRQTIEAAGFRLLRGEGLQVLPGLSVAGIDDPTFIGRGAKARELEHTVLSTLPATDFRMLLKHQPILSPDSDGLVELQLSGHTHGGQIFPFGWLTRRAYPVPMGLSSPRDGFLLYLSRGTGVWGPPMRWPLRSELTLLELGGPANARP